ncbi:protein of unknown function [Candidatus Nitrosocosmicus franklandus]|uniref:Uncharacterized protein n=1 Tax=Candidatus Nitrosocosmicus franklandianus TaxID=1798806 RepID=A0A484I6G4_9ARCH|nr:protein of unknown function [Candidatus Nitrosocosmicus franklandus]
MIIYDPFYLNGVDIGFTNVKILLSLCPISIEYISMGCRTVSTKIYNTGFAMTHAFAIIS